MIESIKFKEDYICFFKGQKFDFKNVTLLVGDQGCGKSTMLSLLYGLIRKNEDSESVDFVLNDSHKGILLLNMETDNPNTRIANPNSSADLLNSMSSKWRSHGENLLPLLNGLLQFENSIILVDEPETALSLRSQYAFIEIVNKMLEKGNQVILSTHSTTFMEAFQDGILSLEHQKYMKLKAFIKTQRQPSDFKEKREDKIIKKTKCKLGINCKCANETGWYNRNCEHYINSRGGYSK